MRFALAAPPINAHFAEAVLLLGFAFVGWESVVVSAGETRDPQRDLPLSSWAETRDVSLMTLIGAALYGIGRWHGKRAGKS